MRLSLLAVFVVLSLAACDKSNAASPAKKAPEQAAAPAKQHAAPGGGALSGKVLETMNAGGYTYLKLQTGAGETWAAVPMTEIAVGDQVAIEGSMPMENFQSKTLNRTFDVIMFGAAARVAGKTPAVMNANANAAAPAAKAEVAAAPIKVDKASGADARSVAEAHAQRAQLKGKPVSIRGKVVKFTSGVMGKNWLHLQDGSSAGKDGDITVTTQDTAAVGDVVLVKGTLQADKDFGAGYAYEVIVEEAKVTK